MFSLFPWHKQQHEWLMIFRLWSLSWVFKISEQTSRAKNECLGMFHLPQTTHFHLTKGLIIVKAPYADFEVNIPSGLGLHTTKSLWSKQSNGESKILFFSYDWGRLCNLWFHWLFSISTATGASKGKSKGWTASSTWHSGFSPSHESCHNLVSLPFTIT